MNYVSHDQVTELYKLAAEPKPKSQSKYEDYKSQQAREKAEWEGQPLHVRSPVLRAMKGAAKGAFKEVSDPTTKKFASKHGPENNEGVGVEGFVFNDDDVHAAERNKPLKKLSSSPAYRAHFKKTMKSKGVDPENLGDADKGKVRKAFKSVDDSWQAEKEAHVLGVYKVAFAQEKEASLRGVVKAVSPKADKAIAAAVTPKRRGSILSAIAEKLIPKKT